MIKIKQLTINNGPIKIEREKYECWNSNKETIDRFNEFQKIFSLGMKIKYTGILSKDEKFFLKDNKYVYELKEDATINIEETGEKFEFYYIDQHFTKKTMSEYNYISIMLIIFYTDRNGSKSIFDTWNTREALLNYSKINVINNNTFIIGKEEIIVINNEDLETKIDVVSKTNCFEETCDYDLFSNSISLRSGRTYININEELKNLFTVKIENKESEKSAIKLSIIEEEEVVIYTANRVTQALSFKTQGEIIDIKGDWVTIVTHLVSGSTNITLGIIFNIKTKEIKTSCSKGFNNLVNYTNEEGITTLAVNLRGKRVTGSNGKQIEYDGKKLLALEAPTELCNDNGERFIIIDGCIKKIDSLLSTESYEKINVEIIVCGSELFVMRKRRFSKFVQEYGYEVELTKITDISKQQQEFLSSISELISLGKKIKKEKYSFQGLNIILSGDEKDILYIIPTMYEISTDSYYMDESTKEKIKLFYELSKGLYSYKFDLSNKNFKTMKKVFIPREKGGISGIIDLLDKKTTEELNQITLQNKIIK